MSGWLNMDYVMSSNKIKALKVTREDIKKAITGSDEVEMKDDLSGIHFFFLERYFEMKDDLSSNV